MDEPSCLPTISLSDPFVNRQPNSPVRISHRSPLFTPDDGVHGREPWAIPLAEVLEP
jgi:hypothetical protein